MPHSHDTMATRMSASKRSAGRHLAFRDAEGRSFRSGWLAWCALSASGTEGHFTSTTTSFPKERRAVSERVCLLESPASTTLLTLTPRGVRFDLGQVGSELADASGSEGLASSPTGAARSSPSVGPASAGGDRRVVAEHLMVASRVTPGTKDTVSLCASVRRGRAPRSIARKRSPTASVRLRAPMGS